MSNTKKQKKINSVRVYHVWKNNQFRVQITND